MVFQRLWIKLGMIPCAECQIEQRIAELDAEIARTREINRKLDDIRASLIEELLRHRDQSWLPADDE